MKTKIVLFTLLLISAFRLSAAPPLEEGKAIFTSRCAGCHNINKVLTGPALAGVVQRRSIDWIVNFVHSSQTLIKTGDKDAIALYNKFNKIPMPDHADLTPDKVKSIVEYIKSESKTTTEEAAPFRKPGKLRPAYNPVSIYNYGLLIGFLGAVVLLIAGLLMAVQIKEVERKKLNDQ